MNALIALAALAVLSLAGEALGFKRYTPTLIVVGLLAALGLNLADWNTDLTYYHKMMWYDNFAVAFTGVMLVSAVLIMLLAPRFYDTLETNRSESYAQMLFLLAGGVVMVSFGNLAMLFLGVEILSIASYILAGSDKRNLYGNEAAIKYFLMGAFSSAFLLFGIALIFAASASFDLVQIAAYVAKGNVSGYMYMGVLMTIIAMSFKVSAAPFHFWAPDVYDGSPTLVTLTMSTIVKVAAFGAMARLFSYALSPIIPAFSHVLWVIIALTIAIGSMSAVFQTSFKRLLAYSGVANAGYLLLGVIVAQKTANAAMLFYAAAYSIATITSFVVMLLLSYKFDDDDISNFKGLAKKQPLLGVAVTVAMLSLAGIPPTAGFFGKYYLFTQAIQAGYTGLVIIAILGSLISIVYYFRVIINMYAPEDSSKEVLFDMPLAYKVVLIISTALTAALGLFPDLLAGII